MQCTLLCSCETFAIMRTVLSWEKITMVHGHLAFSTLCHETLTRAHTMGNKVAFTDHSLHGLADVGTWEYPHEQATAVFFSGCESSHLCFQYKESTVLRQAYLLKK
ncbi:hypothetical protein Dimus_009931 [Dionaea muscipula]